MFDCNTSMSAQVNNVVKSAKYQLINIGRAHKMHAFLQVFWYKASMFVSVRVKDGGRTILPWTKTHMDNGCTFIALFALVVKANIVVPQHYGQAAWVAQLVLLRSKYN